ncbi:MAG: serine/threonine-protein kinase, partial [Polyangiales bacterium]
MSESSQPSRPSRDPWVGSVLDDRYRIIRRIGKGGMGSVYLAEHVLIRRQVAIKTLHPTLSESAEVIERFQREAVAAAAVGNEHIVGVTDMGQLEDGTYYLALEYLEGSEVAHKVESEGLFDVASSLALGLQLCDALTAVHAAGIVHRDLKPENLFLVKRGSPPADFLKIVDFGVCKFREAEQNVRLTATGVALGTPHFMAPEQIEGRRDVDLRADIYAVGGILHFVLAGATPFAAASMPRLFTQICQQPPPPLRTLRDDVPAALERAVLRALAKEPDQRPPSMRDFYAEFTVHERKSLPAGRASMVPLPSGMHLSSGYGDFAP